MSMHRGLAADLWLPAVVGAYGAGAAWAGTADTTKIHPLALVGLFWGVALVSVSIRYLSPYLIHASAALRRHWLAHAAQRADVGRRARVRLVQLPDAVRRSRRHLARG